MTSDICNQIDAKHREAQIAEVHAAEIMQRMKKIPGMTSLVDRLPRRFGEPPNPYRSENKNLTIIGLLERSDPALAHYLAQQAGTSINPPDYNAQAAAAERAAAADRLREQTERLAERNAADQQRRERFANAGIHQHSMRRMGT